MRSFRTVYIAYLDIIRQNTNFFESNWITYIVFFIFFEEYLEALKMSFRNLKITLCLKILIAVW